MPTPVRAFVRRLRSLTSQPHWWAEVWVSAALTGWGIIAVVMPHGINKLHTFDVLVTLAPEWVWERLVLIAGLLQIAALIKNDWRHRGASAFIASSLFGVIFYSFIFGAQIYPSLSLYGAFVGINIMAMYMNIVRRESWGGQ